MQRSEALETSKDKSGQPNLMKRLMSAFSSRAAKIRDDRDAKRHKPILEDNGPRPIGKLGLEMEMPQAEQKTDVRNTKWRFMAVTGVIATGLLSGGIYLLGGTTLSGSRTGNNKNPIDTIATKVTPKPGSPDYMPKEDEEAWTDEEFIGSISHIGENQPGTGVLVTESFAPYNDMTTREISRIFHNIVKNQRISSPEALLQAMRRYHKETGHEMADNETLVANYYTESLLGSLNIETSGRINKLLKSITDPSDIRIPYLDSIVIIMEKTEEAISQREKVLIARGEETIEKKNPGYIRLKKQAQDHELYIKGFNETREYNKEASRESRASGMRTTRRQYPESVSALSNDEKMLLYSLGKKEEALIEELRGSDEILKSLKQTLIQRSMLFSCIVDQLQKGTDGVENTSFVLPKGTKAYIPTGKMDEKGEPELKSITSSEEIKSPAKQPARGKRIAAKK